MTSPLITQNRVRQLAAALIEEQDALFGGRRGPGPVDWFRSLLDRAGTSTRAVAWQQAVKNTNELFAESAGVSPEAAAVEMEALRRQLGTLRTMALEWEVSTPEAQSRTPPDRSRHVEARHPSLYAAAVEALMGFYLGAGSTDDTRIAETQLAWMATRPSALPLFQSERHKRVKAWRRYTELWRGWARSQGSLTLEE